jgi:hypothetical protein
LFASFPELIAGYHVLHRLSMPRHPPYTLSSLTTFIDHRHNGRVTTVAAEHNTAPSARSITDLVRQKGARRYRPDGKTRTSAWGSRLCRGRHRGAIQFVRRRARRLIRLADDHWWIVTFEPHVFTCQRASCPATATSRSLVVHRHRFCPPNAGECALSVRGKLAHVRRFRPTHGHRQIRVCLSRIRVTDVSSVTFLSEGTLPSQRGEREVVNLLNPCGPLSIFGFAVSSFLPSF